MAIHTKIEASDLKKILLPYGIEIIDFSPIDGGNVNTNYHIKSKRAEYILTIAEESTQVEMSQLANLLEWLKRHDFVSSEIKSIVAGKLITTVAGKPTLLKKWIPGQVIENFSNKMLEQIGQALAHLHQIPVPEYLPKSQAYGLQSFPAIQGKGIDLNYENWLANQYDLIKKHLPDNLPKGLIHGDLFFDNVIFQDDQFKAIIDFEEACYYYFIFDLGMSVVGLCRADGKIDLPKIKALINGYEQVRLLTSLEKESLPFFIGYAVTATSNWRFCKYNILSPNPQFRDKHWEMVNVAKEINAIPKGHFSSFVFD